MGVSHGTFQCQGRMKLVQNKVLVFVLLIIFRKLKFVTFMGIYVLKIPFKMLPLKRFVIVPWNVTPSVIHSLL